MSLSVDCIRALRHVSLTELAKAEQRKPWMDAVSDAEDIREKNRAADLMTDSFLSSREIISSGEMMSIERVFTLP